MITPFQKKRENTRRDRIVKIEVERDRNVRKIGSLKEELARRKMIAKSSLEIDKYLGV